MKIDADELTKTMIRAASAEARDCWPSMQRVAELEFRRFAQTLEEVIQLHAADQFDDLQAFAIAATYRAAAINAMGNVKGLGRLTGRAAARDAMRAAVEAARDTVNLEAGIRLL